jgi:ABC-type uncharacterized transport system involved in gliding motility auxiliary subunit
MSTNPTGPAKGKTAAEAIITAVAVIAALVLLNVVSCRARTKLDLTENKIYSLSSSSKQLVRGMTEPVNIRAYFGNVPPEQAEKATYVDMLLSEYADASPNGKIDYQKIDPWGDAKLQDELKKQGVQELQLQSLKDDSFQQVPMYFHVVFSHLDKREVWTPTQGFNLEGLEYEFTTRIKRLASGKKKVGVTTGFGEPQRAQALEAPGADVLPGVKVGLGDLYDVTTVDWAKNPKSIDDVDVLVVNGPTEKVSDAAKFHLDQRIMHGKAVLFLVSGYRWQSGNGQPQFPGMEQPDQPYIGMPGDNGLQDLLAGYGFEVGRDVILDAKNSARLWIPPGSRQGGVLALGFAPFAEALANGPRDILAHIDVVAMPFPSSLQLVGPLAADKRDADTQVIELLRTAPTSWKHTELLAIARDFKGPPAKDPQRFLVGAVAAAQFKSYYANHPVPANVDLAAPGAPGPMAMPPDPDDGEADPPAPASAPASQPAGSFKDSSLSHTRVAVVTAPGLAADQSLMDVQRTGEIVFVNGFVAVHNLVDWLAEDTDLVAVRGKKVERPLAKLDSGQRALVKYANVVGAPLLLTVVGLITWRVRERRRRNIVL